MGATRCLACGAMLEAGDGFCMTCGQPVAAAHAGIEAATTPVAAPRRGWPMSRLLLIAGGVVLLCVIAVLVALVLSRRPPELPGEELIPVDPASTGRSSITHAPPSMLVCSHGNAADLVTG
ncbi:MAG: hypothetical protein V1750_05150 [Acidobacteriota bacterium]